MPEQQDASDRLNALKSDIPECSDEGLRITVKDPDTDGDGEPDFSITQIGRNKNMRIAPMPSQTMTVECVDDKK